VDPIGGYFLRDFFICNRLLDPSRKNQCDDG